MSEFSSEPRTAPRPNPAPRPGRRSALALWTISGAGLVLVNLLSLPLSRAMAGLDAQVQTLIYNLTYYLAFAALPVCLLARRRPGLWRAYRPYPISGLRVLTVVALALLGVLVFTDLSALWTLLLEALGLPLGGGDIPLPASAPGLVLCVFCIAALPAVCEEFVFRGAILSSFEPNGTRRAIWITALLFALLHGSLAGFPVQFLIGAVLGWLVVCSDSIYAGLIYHTTHNAAMVLMQFVANRRMPDVEVESMMQAVGGWLGIFQLLLELLVLGMMMLFALKMFGMTARLRGVEFTPPRRGGKLRASEWALLIAGLLCVGLLFGANLWIDSLAGGGA